MVDQGDKNHDCTCDDIDRMLFLEAGYFSLVDQTNEFDLIRVNKNYSAHIS